MTAYVEGDTFAVDNLRYQILTELEGDAPGTVSLSGCSDSSISEVKILDSVKYPDSQSEYTVTSIGDYAFSDCSSLEKITIPEGVRSIGDGAFLGCSSLERITIPEGVESIGKVAFFECNSLNTVYLPCDKSLNKDYLDLFDGTSLFDTNPELEYENHSWETENKNGTQHTLRCMNCDKTVEEDHSYGTEWSKDASGHWYECTVCGYKKDSADHTPGAAATEDTPQICNVCGYEITPTLSHTHSYGDWVGGGDGTHTRICSGNSEHKETEYCSGGTATCKSKATCTDCRQPYGSTNLDNHSGGTEVRGAIPATETTDGYTGDTYCLGCEVKISTGSVIPATGSGSGGNDNNGSGDDDDNSSDDGNTSNNGAANDPSTTVTPAPSTTTAPAPAPTTLTYIVQKGDTLSKIARMFDCTVKDIVALNSGLIKNPNLILIGWELTIPVGGLQQEAPSTGNSDVYVVQSGDTLSSIAKRHGCKWRDIVALNGDLITDPDLILPGWQLKLPQ